MQPYHAAHECMDCNRPFETERRGALVCPGCTSLRVRSVLNTNGDGPEDDIIWVDFSGRPVTRKRDTTPPGNWSTDIRRPVGIRERIRARYGR